MTNLQKPDGNPTSHEVNEIYITRAGDPSVGIQDERFVLIGYQEIEDEFLEQTRNDVKELFVKWGDPVSVQFDFELALELAAETEAFAKELEYEKQLADGDRLWNAQQYAKDYYAANRQAAETDLIVMIVQGSEAGHDDTIL